MAIAINIVAVNFVKIDMNVVRVASVVTNDATCF